MSEAVNLRPILPKDAEELAELFALSIELLTQNDYSEEQRLAWMSAAAERALSPAHRALLAAAGFRVEAVELEAIEAAGGSLRCCIGELF